MDKKKLGALVRLCLSLYDTERTVELLDAMKDDEKDVQKELRNQPVEGRYRVDKDW